MYLAMSWIFGLLLTSDVFLVCFYLKSGNNIYKEEIRTTLQKTAGTADRSKYILMDRIIPHSVKNYVIRPGYSHTETADYVSEFGFYGSFVR